MFPHDDFIGAHTALGTISALSGSRDAILDYAVSADLTWALPGFLARRGWLDDEWRRRLRELRTED